MSRLSVYRVEHPASGYGPFGSDSPEALRDAISDYCARQGAFLPEAHEDCPGFVPGYHVCGVWPLSKVDEWFGPFRAQLLAAGFVLVVYEPLLSNIVRSRSHHQIGFPRYEATPRRQLAWPEPDMELAELSLYA